MITEKNSKYFNINNGYYNRNAVKFSNIDQNTQRTQCIDCSSHPSAYAMSYVLNQEYENLYRHDEALCKGTLFCDLYKPYYAGDRRI